MKSDRHIVFVGSDAEMLRAVKAAAAGVRVEAVSGPAARRIAGQPGVIVVQVDPAVPADLDRVHQLAAPPQEALVIAAAPGADPEQVRRLFRAGAADVLAGPLDPGVLSSALREALAVSPLVGEVSTGGVISIVKGCGGAGATTLALNVGAALAQGDAKRGRPARSTAVLDLDLQFGDAALALDLTPRSTIVDVLRAQQRVDARFVHSVMSEHDSGLRLLAGPPSVVPLDAVSAEVAVELIEHAAASFERTLIDLPPSWTDWTFPVLHRSDLIVLVTSPTVAGALGARRVLEALAEAGVERPVLLVLNKLAGVIDAFEKPSRIGKSLDMGVDAALGLDPAAVKASDRGQLVVEAFAGSRLAKELRTLAGKIDGRIEALNAGVAFTEMAA